MNYKEQLQNNNTKLKALITKLDNLSGFGATATSNDILENKTAFVDGKKIEGNIPIMEGCEIMPLNENYTLSTKGKYLSGDITILTDENLKSEYIKQGIEIFGVKGNYTNFYNGIITMSTPSFPNMNIIYYDFNSNTLVNQELSNSYSTHEINQIPQGSIISIQNIQKNGKIGSLILDGMSIIQSSEQQIDLIVLKNQFVAVIQWMA